MLRTALYQPVRYFNASIIYAVADQKRIGLTVVIKFTNMVDVVSQR